MTGQASAKAELQHMPRYVLTFISDDGLVNGVTLGELSMTLRQAQQVFVVAINFGISITHVPISVSTDSVANDLSALQDYLSINLLFGR